MITAIVYLIDAIILAYFSYRVFRSGQMENPFMEYFLGITAFFSINFFAYSFFILAAIYANQPGYLFWADYFGRLFVYIGSIFAVQVPLYKIAPKHPLRYLGSAAVAVIGVTMAYLNLLYRNQPFIDNLNIVHWEAPVWLGIGLAAVILGIWVATSFIFIKEYFDSKYKLKKSLILGLGFLLGATGSALQDFGTTTSSYIFINGVLTIGFIMIFIGVFYKDKK